MRMRAEGEGEVGGWVRGVGQAGREPHPSSEYIWRTNLSTTPRSYLPSHAEGKWEGTSGAGYVRVATWQRMCVGRRQLAAARGSSWQIALGDEMRDEGGDVGVALDLGAHDLRAAKERRARVGEVVGDQDRRVCGEAVARQHRAVRRHVVERLALRDLA